MNQKRIQTATARCIECDARIIFKRQPEQRDSVLCPECDAHLQIISLSPLELYWAIEDKYYSYRYDDSGYDGDNDDMSNDYGRI